MSLRPDELVPKSEIKISSSKPARIKQELSAVLSQEQFFLLTEVYRECSGLSYRNLN